MVSMSTFIETLRDCAERLDRIVKDGIGANMSDIREAAQVLGFRLPSAKIEFTAWVADGGLLNSVEWMVWDGAEQHRAVTLEQAMQKCLAKLDGKPPVRESMLPFKDINF